MVPLELAHALLYPTCSPPAYSLSNILRPERVSSLPQGPTKLARGGPRVPVRPTHACFLPHGLLAPAELPADQASLADISLVLLG